MSDLSHRRLQPELLDELPAADPRAEHSRSDLRRLNGLMGHARTIARQLNTLAGERTSLRIIEIGAGDGTLLLSVAEQFARSHPGTRTVEAWLIDQQPLVTIPTEQALARIGWQVRPITADVFDWLAKRPAPPVDMVVANLFLHHFEGEPLRRLLQLMAANCEAAIACEPRRSRPALAAASVLGLIGCNEVTRHDAVLSVRAGFAGDELSQHWPEPAAWSLTERSTGLFSHLFVAQRNDSP